MKESVNTIASDQPFSEGHVRFTTVLKHIGIYKTA